MKNSHQVDIPLLFFSFAFFILLFGLFSKLSFQKKGSITPSPIPQKKNIKEVTPLNYNLPIMCDYQSKESSISAAIDGNLVKLTLGNSKNTQKYVIQGDCMYLWNTNELKGKKKCGVGSTLSMGRQLLHSGLATVDSLVEMMQQSSKTSSSLPIKAAFETCKNVKEIGREVFILPKSVKFE